MSDDKTGKARITITLRQDLLSPLDNFIDGEKIRNRSHAIEYILGQHLGLGIETAVIFAGTNSETDKLPALIKVKKRPVIAYVLDTLKVSGIRNVIVVIDNKGSELKEFLGDGSQWGVRVTTVHDRNSFGTANALSLTAPLIDSSFLLIYSDILADLNLNDFVEHHTGADSIGTVALTYKRSAGEYGVARLEGNKIAEYAEKPGKEGKHGLVNAGIYLFEPTIFDYLTEDSKSLENEVLPRVAKDGQLSGYPFQGKWFDISKEKGHTAAEKEWR